MGICYGIRSALNCDRDTIDGHGSDSKVKSNLDRDGDVKRTNIDC